MLSTYEQRRDQFLKVARDVDNVEPQEFFSFMYHWYKYELAIRKEAKAQRQINRHSEKLKTLIHVFNARHEMQDL